MRTKVTLALIFLNVALFGFIFYFQERWITDENLKDARRRVIDASVANIQILEISGLPEPVRIERRTEGWVLTSPVEWPANPHAVSKILNELQFLERDASFSVAELSRNGQTLADYGLDRPALTLTFTPAPPAGNPGVNLSPVVLRIGAETKVGNRLYLLSPDGERVLVVGRTLAESLRINLEQLRAESIFTIPVFEVRSLGIQAAAANNLRVRLRREGNRWSFETPILARASKTATEIAINQLNSLTVEEFPEGPSAAAESAGLASPSFRITVEGNNRRETMLLGNEVAGAPVSGGAESEERLMYARFEDRPAVFTLRVPTELINKLRNAQEKLRETRILDLEGRIVTSLTLRAPGQPELTLQRLEAGAASGDAGAWQMVRRDPTAPGAGPQTVRADGRTVSRLLQNLTALTVQPTESESGFLSDAPSAAELENWGFTRPEREIVLSLSDPAATSTEGVTTSSTTQITLQLGVASQREGRVYAKLASQDFVYLVTPEILPLTPVVPRFYREKLLRDLPEGAQITGLELVNTADRRVIYARQLSGGETWDQALTEETPPRREAIRGLLAQLRTLRAKSYVADTFPTTVLGDGEERPWAYQLDATLALVGGGALQTSTTTLFLAERTGGSQQLIGSPEFGVVFEAEQPLLDSLWTLIYGPRDPGPPSPQDPSARPGATGTAPAP